MKQPKDKTLFIDPITPEGFDETTAESEQEAQDVIAAALNHPERGSRVGKGIHAIGEEALALQMLRNTLGITQTELAARLGVAQPQISQIEARTDLRLSTLIQYIKATGGELSLQARYQDRTYEINIPTKDKVT